MVINQLNSGILNTLTVNIHDYIFDQLVFDYSTKKVCVEISAENSRVNKRKIEFVNVVGINMVSCDFWGRSPHILDWEVRDRCEQTMIRSLIEEQRANNYFTSRLVNETSFFESLISFTSGDRLTIACEYIIWDGDNSSTGDGLREPY